MTVVAVYLLGGCIMDALALVMLTIPIFYPVIVHLGYDPIWFGVIIVLLTQMGVITPPVGINVYVVYVCGPERHRRSRPGGHLQGDHPLSDRGDHRHHFDGRFPPDHPYLTQPDVLVE
jgi:hypothetical protein